MIKSKVLNGADKIPFILIPAAKDYLWGGERLNKEFNKNINLHPIAETWECSTHPDGSSIIASGNFKGKSFAEILKEYPQMLGKHSKKTGELPILIKFIDAKENLSVQVHPDDDYAKKYENGQYGKSELWYVVDADKDTSIVYGFQTKITKQQLKKSINTGTIEKYMNKVFIHKDDVFFIEAGMVHAIGAGALIVEVQENSNLTYRLYDYNRVDKNGYKRELHIDKALDVANLNAVGYPRQPMRVAVYRKGWASELLCRCKYFQVERVLLNSDLHRCVVPIKTQSISFEVFLCVNGGGEIELEDNRNLTFRKGDCIFFPANSISVRLKGKAQLLRVRG